MTRPFVLALVVLILAGDGVQAGVLHPRAPDFAAKYEPFTLVLGPTRRLLYGTYRGTLHLLETRNGALVRTLTRELWSPVLKMLAADLDGDGQDEVIGYTQNWRLFVLNGAGLQDIWNTQEGRFKRISALTVADVDNDGALEILFIADGLLRISSGLKDIEEWKSTETYQDSQILVGDVDGDGQDEIVMSSGLVLGALFRDEEWRYEPGFGVEMDLYDIDNDGKPEIVGIGSDGLIRVFDVDERRVRWN